MPKQKDAIGSELGACGDCPGLDFDFFRDGSRGVAKERFLNRVGGLLRARDAHGHEVKIQ